MWDNLPNHLKTGLTIALIMVAGVAAAGFVLSFVALREVAANPVTGWASYAWIFPLCLDAALIAAEVTYISAGMIRGLNRALPLACIFLFGAITVWFNMERVPGSWRAVTAIPPIAGIAMTLLIAYLLKAFARATGTTIRWDAPSSGPGVLRPYDGPIRGSIHRGDEGMPSVMRSEASEANGQIGQGWGSGGVAPTKRQQIESYLDYLGPDEAKTLGARGITTDLRNSGVDVSERYVKQALDARNGKGHP